MAPSEVRKNGCHRWEKADVLDGNLGDLMEGALKMDGLDIPGQIIATFPAGWSPQMVVNSKGIPAKSP